LQAAPRLAGRVHTTDGRCTAALTPAGSVIEVNIPGRCADGKLTGSTPNRNACSVLAMTATDPEGAGALSP
jgi:hypothetical protein